MHSRNGGAGRIDHAVISLNRDCRTIGVPRPSRIGTASGRDTPTLVDIMPSGRFLMEDFY